MARLEERRSKNNEVLKEIGDIKVDSMDMMSVTGVGANHMTLAGLAFGLACNNFKNINSRLLIEVEKGEHAGQAPAR